MKIKTYEKWMDEYDKDIFYLFQNLMYILKRKNMLYKEFSFEKFSKLIYLKSSKRQINMDDNEDKNDFSIEITN